MAKLILIIIGIVCLFIAGLGGIGAVPRPRWEWLGLAFIACGLYLPL